MSHGGSTKQFFQANRLSRSRARGASHGRESRLRPVLLSICLVWMAFGQSNAQAGVQAGAPIDLEALRGRVVYLDFWASWCVPCRLSFPWMQSMQDAHAADGLTVIAVNVDRERAAADRFLQQFHPQFDVRFDPEGSLAERYKVQGMPASMVIDRHGVVRFTHIGFRPIDGAIYERQLRELLAEK